MRDSTPRIFPPDPSIPVDQYVFEIFICQLAVKQQIFDRHGRFTVLPIKYHAFGYAEHLRQFGSADAGIHLELALVTPTATTFFVAQCIAYTTSQANVVYAQQLQVFARFLPIDDFPSE